MRIIEAVAGSQLDPDLARAFIGLVAEDEEWLDAIRPTGPVSGPANG